MPTHLSATNPTACEQVCDNIAPSKFKANVSGRPADLRPSCRRYLAPPRGPPNGIVFYRVNVEQRACQYLHRSMRSTVRFRLIQSHAAGLQEPVYRCKLQQSITDLTLCIPQFSSSTPLSRRAPRGRPGRAALHGAPALRAVRARRLRLGARNRRCASRFTAAGCIVISSGFMIFS